jgi:hypothetical protein
MPPLQVVRGAVHEPAPGLAPQQSWPGPPQVPQVPALHVSPPMLAQLAPAARQMPKTQHPPLSQLLPAQHAKPGCPHGDVLPPVPWTPPPTPAEPPAPAKPPPPRPAESVGPMLTSANSLPCEPSPLPPPWLDPPHAPRPDAPAIDNIRKPIPLGVMRVLLWPAILRPCGSPMQPSCPCRPPRLSPGVCQNAIGASSGNGSQLW